MSDIYETKRTIEEVLDLETGLIINSKEFFSQPESILVSYRRQLQEAILGYESPKFVCPYCKQLVKLSGMSTQRGMVSFFAHLHDSDECEIKTNSNLTKEEIEAIKYGNVRESQRHIDLKDDICSALTFAKSIEIGVTNVAVEKRIISKIPYLNWRQPDISAEFKGRKIVFELQLSTTFLSVIVERDIFYKMNNIFIVWVFNFSDNQEYVNMSNLMCKDIYYSNKRNAFVFDDMAMQLSAERNELILLCIWFEPFIENGIFNSSKSVKKLEYISLNDLKFDEVNYKPYYIDADKLFAKYQPSLYKQREIDENAFIKILDRFTRNTEKKIAQNQNKENENLSIKEKLRSGEVKLMPFLKGEKWGYEVEGVVVVEPKYSEAADFLDNQFARVKKNKKFGFVNLLGELHIPCDYIETFDILNGKCVAKEGSRWFTINLKDRDKEIIDAYKIQQFERSKNYIKITNRVTTQVIDWVSKSGYKKYKDKHTDTHGILSLDGKILINQFSRIYIITADLIVFEKNSEIFICDQNLNNVFAYTFDEISSISKDNTEFVVKKDEYYGYVNLAGKILIPFEYDYIKGFSEGIARAKQNEKWGLIDKRGKIIVPFEFYDIKDFNFGIAKANKDGFLEKWGCIDMEGKTIIPFKYDYNEIETTSDGKIKAKKAYKWGCFDNKGKNIIPFKYDLIDEFIDGRAKAKKDGKTGYVDEYGNEIIEEVIEIGSKILIGKKFEKWGIEGTEGNIILPYEYDVIKAFVDGRAKVKRDGKWGVVDTKWEIIIPFEYEIIEEFVDGKSKVKRNGKWGVVDSKWEIIIPCEYEIIEEFVGGIAKVRRNGKWGVVDSNWEVIIPSEYDRIEDFVDGKAEARREGKLGIIDSKGGIMIPIEYSIIEDFVDGRAKAKRDGKWGVIDLKGEIIIPFEYDMIQEFANDLVKVGREGKLGIIDSRGEIIIPIEYNTIQEFVNDRVIVIKDWKWGVIDFKSEIIIPFEYDLIQKFTNDRVIVEKDRQWGIIDSIGEIVIPIDYDTIQEFINDRVKAKKDGKWGIIDFKGEIIIPFEYDTIEYYENGNIRVKNFGIYETMDPLGLLETKNRKSLTENVFLGQKFGKYGLENKSGRILIPFKYDGIVPYANGKALCFINDEFKIECNDAFELQKHKTIVDGVANFGVFVQMVDNEKIKLKGLLHISEIIRANETIEEFKRNDYFDLYIAFADGQKQRISFSINPPKYRIRVSSSKERGNNE